MKANFDNMRILATGNMNELGRVLKEKILIMDNYYIDDELKQEIVTAFNNTACRVDSLNCLYDDNIPDDVNDLSETIEVERLELEEKEEDEDEL
ncbi:hypothetical protein [Sulfurospirillum cavolei]|uniref:hypothetical protein n=1 Tax=Sulfurospirillum cavolei TaxID=366522 RepID=UPI0005A8B0F5|nr:hypothetical protein [Sulfurospirillum cavolei]